MNRIAVTLLLLLVTTGCSQSEPAVVKVSGVVTSEGVPLTDANVMFVPRSGRDEQRRVIPIAFGRTDDSGRYELSLPGGVSGARTGVHLVMISKVEELLPESRTDTQEESESKPGIDPQTRIDVFNDTSRGLSEARKKELIIKAYQLARPYRTGEPLGETVFSAFNRETVLKFEVPEGGTDAADFEVGRDPALID